MDRRENLTKAGLRVNAWLLYDDSCGFCRRWVPFWKSTLLKRGIEIAPLQARWVQETLGISAADLLDDLRLWTCDGQHIRGADVYRWVMRRIWWAHLFYLLSTAPVLRRVFDFCYRTFALNRFRFSRACGLQHRLGER